MDKALAHHIKDKFLAKGADDVVVSLATDKRSQVKFHNSGISTTMNWDLMSASLFISKDRKLAYTTIKDLDKESINLAVEKLIKFAESSVPNKEFMGIAEGPFTYREIDGTYDKKIAELGEKSIDYVEGAMNAARENGAERSAGIFEASETSNILVTSNDVEAEDKGTHAYFSMRSFAAKDASCHRVINSRTLAGMKLEPVAIDSAITAKMALKPQPGAAGKFDVIFEPLSFSNLLERLGNAASIFSVESGLSCLGGKLGAKVASEKVRFSDNAALPGGIDSRKFDDEGVPTQNNAIIENGVLKTHLHNTSTAKRYGVKTTASAGVIAPDARNLVLEKGNFNKSEIIESVKRGLIITNVWYTRFQNYESGDFSTIPRDAIFYIENGKIKNPVKDIRISENLLNIMKNVKALANDAIPSYGWEVSIPVVSPSVLVKDVNITRSVE